MRRTSALADRGCRSLALGSALAAQIAFPRSRSMRTPNCSSCPTTCTSAKRPASPPIRRAHLRLHAHRARDATLGTRASFTHGGSRLFEFDQTGKFVREIGAGRLRLLFAQVVRVDPQDNIWVVDEVSTGHQVRSRRAHPDALGRKPEAIAVRRAAGGSGGGAPAAARGGRAAAAGGAPAGGRPGAGVPGDSFNRPTDVGLGRAGQHLRLRRLRQLARIAKFDKNGEVHQVVGPARHRARAVQLAARHRHRRAGQRLRRPTRGNKRIQVFDNDGTFKTQFHDVGAPWAICITPGAHQYLYSLELERPRRHRQRRDLQDGARRQDRRQVRPGRQAAEGVRHRSTQIDCRSENEMLRRRDSATGACRR